MPDAIIAEGAADGICDVATAVFAKTRRNYVFILLVSGPGGIESEMQKIVDRERCDIICYQYDGNKKIGV